MTRLCILLGGHFSDVPGGAEYQAGLIADKLAKTGEFEVFYLARAMDPACRPGHYQLIQIKQKNRLNRYAFVFDAIELYRVLSDIQPDIIYQRGLLAYTGIAAYYARKNDCRLVFHIASDLDVTPFDKVYTASGLLKYVDRMVGEYGIRRAGAIVAQTQQQADFLKAHHGRNATAVIGNFHPLPMEKICKREPVKIIWVANLKPNKRPELFVRLASDLQYWDGVRFIMIGHPGSLQKYSALHKEINNLRNIEFFGIQTLGEVNKQLAQGHIFINTSIKEGFPNTFVQAWMRETPVISVEVDLDGLLANGDIGLLSGSYDQLKKDVEHLLKEPALRKEMGLKARNYAVANHSPARFEELLRVIRGC